MTSAKNSSQVLQFGVYEIDLKSRELRKSGLRKRLQPQPFKVLALLASRAGEVVTREELQEHVWDDDTHVDFEHGLNYCVRQVRTALGDNADSPRFVETLPRIGYRFIAEVKRIAPQGAPASQAPASPASAGESRHDWTPAALLALAAVLLAAFVLWQQMGPPVESSSQPMRLAVLPFQPRGPQAVESYVLAGLTEDLILNLAQQQGDQSLELIAFTSSWHYRNQEIDTRKVAEELNVDYILYGTLQRRRFSALAGEDDNLVLARATDATGAEGDSASQAAPPDAATGEPGMEITAHLVDTVTHRTVKIREVRLPWRRPLLEAGTAAREIAQTMSAELLGVEETPERRYSCELAPPSDTPLAVRELCAQGRFQARSKHFAESIESLREALRQRPDFLPAVAALAWSYAQAPFYESEYRGNQTWDLAESAARRALQAQPDLWEAELALAVSLFYRDWNWADAEQHYRRALAQAPEAETDPAVWMAGFLSAAGRHQEALQLIEQANRHDLMSALVGGDYAWHLYHAGQFRRAVRQARRGMNLSGFSAWSRLCLLYSGLALDDHALTLEAVRGILKERLNSNDEGVRRRSHAFLETLDALPPAQAVDKYLTVVEELDIPPYRKAVVQAHLGKREAMYESLRKALPQKGFGPLFMAHEPAFEPYRQEAAFQELARQVYDGAPGH